MTDGSDADVPTGGDRVCAALADAGVETVVGIPGTQTLPLDVAVDDHDDLTYLMARDETAIPHVAWGHYESGGGLAATVTVPGPGDAKATHGLKNALGDCVPLVHVSADVPADRRGDGPIHEIAPDTFDNVVRTNLTVETPDALPSAVARGLRDATTPPYGPVRLGVGSDVLAGECAASPVEYPDATPTVDNDGAVARAAARLADADRPLVYVGGGTRRSPDRGAVVDLVRRLNLPVVASYKGKGVVPDDDPRTLGVTGTHTPASARAAMAAADCTLALGTDFDGVSTGHWSLPMGDRLVHVNVDPADLSHSYEVDVGVVGDAGAVARRLADRVDAGGAWDGAAVGRAVREEYDTHLRDAGLLDERTPMPTPAALRALREAIAPGAVVTTDVGGFRLWAKQVFDALGPERYVTAGSWAGMGVGVPAALGAAVADPDRPVACLTGDGGLMMSVAELHTAATAGLDVTVFAFNNADYGVISKSGKLPAAGPRFDWPSPDFATVAEGFDCAGFRAESVPALREAAADALAVDGPALVDVVVDPETPTAADAADYDSGLSW
ncbi:MAG: thiamine pyrophosphate-binding protein [Haloferacaceae archaeon]